MPARQSRAFRLGNGVGRGRSGESRVIRQRSKDDWQSNARKRRGSTASHRLLGLSGFEDSCGHPLPSWQAVARKPPSQLAARWGEGRWISCDMFGQICPPSHFPPHLQKQVPYLHLHTERPSVPSKSVATTAARERDRENMDRLQANPGEGGKGNHNRTRTTPTAQRKKELGLLQPT